MVRALQMELSAPFGKMVYPFPATRSLSRPISSMRRLPPHNLLPLLESRCARVIGMDISFEVVRTAKERLTQDGSREREAPWCRTRGSQAFLTGTFDYIVSNSTLDHFEESDDLIKSLRELERILKPGGGAYNYAR